MEIEQGFKVSINSEDGGQWEFTLRIIPTKQRIIAGFTGHIVKVIHNDESPELNGIKIPVEFGLTPEQSAIATVMKFLSSENN